MPKVHVQYFALLREQRGRAEETLDTPVTTPGELYAALRAAHGLSLPPERVRAAVNDEFVAATTPLRDGDRVVFIPPVAGG